MEEDALAFKEDKSLVLSILLPPQIMGYHVVKYPVKCEPEIFPRFSETKATS